MTIPQMFSAGAGVVFCAGSLYVFFRQNTRRFKALFWLAVGLTMVFAAFRPQMIELLGKDTTELRLRLVVALLSFIVLTVTLEAIRIARMQERYAFLWLVTGCVLFIGAVSGDIAALVARVTGMSYGATVMVILFSFVMLMLFHFSVALSKLQNKLSRVVREAALAEERLRQVEGRVQVTSRPAEKSPE
jgi:hypothetical protein